MIYSESYCIVTKEVLNNNTGELETIDFKELKQSKRIKGGFKMIYSSYDDALLQIVKSGKDLEIVIHIRDKFTYARPECVLSAVDLSNELNIAKSKITEIINRMVKSKLIMRVSRGVYRLNPFMYLPFRCNGEELQSEWNHITKKIETYTIEP